MDGRPVVFQEVKIQQQATDAPVPIAERVDRLELEVHPRSERKRSGAFHVLLGIRLLPGAHEGEDFLHPRRNMPDARNPDVHAPPLTRIQFDTSEYRFVEV